jgi:hypothetical protein
MLLWTTQNNVFFDLQVDPGEYHNAFNASGQAGNVAACMQMMQGTEMLQASSNNYQEGRAGTLGVPALKLSARPVQGTTPDLLIANSLGVPNLGVLVAGFWGTRQTDAAWLYGPVSVLPAWTALIAIPSGGTTIPLPIPNTPALAGSTWMFQVVQPDPGAAFGWAMSPGLHVLMLPN